MAITSNGFPYPLLTETADIEGPTSQKGLANFLETVFSNFIPVGTVMQWSGASDPSHGSLTFGHWLVLDGRSLSRATYPALFTALGGTSSPWGFLDGSSFYLPNAGGRVIVGRESGLGLEIGVTGGVDEVTLTAEESGLREHNHNTSEAPHGHDVWLSTVGDPTSGSINIVNISQVAGNFGDPTHPAGNHVVDLSPNITGLAVLNAAADNALAPHQNMPPYIVMNYIIRAK